MAMTHRIRTSDEDEDERCHWECDCGTSGSAASWKVDLASDRHVDHERGDIRIDVYGGWNS